MHASIWRNHVSNMHIHRESFRAMSCLCLVVDGLVGSTNLCKVAFLSALMAYGLPGLAFVARMRGSTAVGTFLILIWIFHFVSLLRTTLLGLLLALLSIFSFIALGHSIGLYEFALFKVFCSSLRGTNVQCMVEEFILIQILLVNQIFGNSFIFHANHQL